MVALADVQAHRADVALVAEDAQAEVRTLLSGIESPDEARSALMDTLPLLMAERGAAAATLGADWYDDLRDAAAVRGAFAAIVSELPDVGRAYALAGAATAPATAGGLLTMSTVLSVAEGGVQRFVADMDRASVIASSAADPQSLGWQRVGSGACGFCAMLISRAILYRSETSARFGSHDNCQCAATPAWGGDELPVRAYEPTSRNITDADRARVRDWISRNT